MKMKIKTIFFSLLLFFVASDVLAQGYPVIVPSATWTKPDGTEEEGETMSSAAPLIGHFYANPVDDEGFTSHYEWRFTREKETEPYLIRYEQDTDFTFNEAGTHIIVCYATFTNGTQTYEYKEEYWATEGVPITCTVSSSKLEMPNAFSPNGDDKNPTYKPKVHQSIVEFHATIYNRWGQALYSWDNVNDQGWDGTYHGKPVAQGTYFVEVHARGADGIEYKIRRDVNLLRGFTASRHSPSTLSLPKDNDATSRRSPPMHATSSAAWNDLTLTRLQVFRPSSA